MFCILPLHNVPLSSLSKILEDHGGKDLRPEYLVRAYHNISDLTSGWAYRMTWPKRTCSDSRDSKVNTGYSINSIEAQPSCHDPCSLDPSSFQTYTSIHFWSSWLEKAASQSKHTM